MISPPVRLAQLQRWMLKALSSRAAPAVDDVLLPSLQQSAVDRLAVYRSAYSARLIECLRELFPVLAATLGREEFDSFATGYLDRSPSTSYTLNRLADRFADYLAETKPDLPSPDWPDFLIELARVEHAIDQVFDGPGIEILPPLDVSPLTDAAPEQQAAIRLAVAPCLRLFALEFPINDYYGAVRRGEPPSWPAPAKSYLAITRRDYVVRRVPLEEAEYSVLTRLASGQTLGESLAADVSLRPGHVATWFEAWGRMGLFVARE